MSNLKYITINPFSIKNFDFIKFLIMHECNVLWMVLGLKLPALPEPKWTLPTSWMK